MSPVPTTSVPTVGVVRRIERATRRVLTGLEDDPGLTSGRELAAQLIELSLELGTAPDLNALRELPLEASVDARRLINRAIDMTDECIAYLTAITDPSREEAKAAVLASLESTREYLVESDHDVLDVIDERTLAVDENEPTIPWADVKARLGLPA